MKNLLVCLYPGWSRISHRLSSSRPSVGLDMSEWGEGLLRIFRRREGEERKEEKDRDEMKMRKMDGTSCMERKGEKNGSL